MTNTTSPSPAETYTLRESYFIMGTRILGIEIIFLSLSLLVKFVAEAAMTSFGLSGTNWYYLFFSLLQIINTLFIISVVLRWAGLMYIIKPNELIIRIGIFNSKAVSYDLSALQAITLIQTWIGKIFNFGTIKLYNPVLKEDIYINNIHNPSRYAEIIKEYEKRTVGIIPRFKAR